MKMDTELGEATNIFSFLRTLLLKREYRNTMTEKLVYCLILIRI